MRNLKRAKFSARITTCLIIALTISTVAFAVEIKFDKELKFREGEAPIKPWDLNIPTEGKMIITDYSGRVLLYSYSPRESSPVLNFKKSIGEFSEPAYLSFDETNQMLAVMDYGDRCVKFYEWNGAEFSYIGKFECLRLGYDILIRGDQLFISGMIYNRDSANSEFPFSLYSADHSILKSYFTLERKPRVINHSDTTIKFYLPSHRKYSFESREEYLVERDKSIKKRFGRKLWFTEKENTIYAVWEGDASNIIKIDLATEKVAEKKLFQKPLEDLEKDKFGNKVFKRLDYKDTATTSQLKEYIENKNFKKFLKAKARYSFPKGIFASRDHILLVVATPMESGEETNIWLYTFSLNGTLQHRQKLEAISQSDGMEKARLLKPSFRLSFDKKSNNLYSIGTTQDNKFTVLRFKVYD